MIDLILLGARYLLLLLINLFILQVLRAIHTDLRDLLPRRETERASLEVQESPGHPMPGTYFPVYREARIGGGSECTVVVPGDPQSARARIFLRDGRFWVEATGPGEAPGAAVAALVNGTRVSDPLPLRDGDRVTVGRVVFRFHWSGG